MQSCVYFFSETCHCSGATTYLTSSCPPPPCASSHYSSFLGTRTPFFENIEFEAAVPLQYTVIIPSRTDLLEKYLLTFSLSRTVTSQFSQAHYYLSQGKSFTEKRYNKTTVYMHVKLPTYYPYWI